MKVHPISDIHIEMRSGYKLKKTDADLIVLVGDIHNGIKGVKWAIEQSKKLQTPVIYVAGNHEYYRHEYHQLLSEMREITLGTNVHFLENDELILEGVRFLGTTLWTDYKCYRSFTQRENMEYLGGQLNDHYVIRFGDRLFAPSDALSLNNKAVKWLKERLGQHYNGPTVVVSHHAPSVKCAHYKFGLNELSTGFISDLEPLVKKADYWFFGHTHSNLDTKIGECRLVSNQVGYPSENLPVPYDDNLLITVKRNIK